MKKKKSWANKAFPEKPYLVAICVDPDIGYGAFRCKDCVCSWKKKKLRPNNCYYYEQTELIDTKAAGLILHKTPASIRLLIKKKKLFPVCQSGRVLLLAKSHVEDFLYAKRNRT